MTKDPFHDSGKNGPRTARTSWQELGDRRKDARFLCCAAVEAVEVQSAARATGRTSDLGLGGCYVDTLSPFNKGAILKVRLTGDGKSFESRAEVIASSVGMGMSLAFLSVEPEQRNALERWIAELNGEVVSDPEIVAAPSVQAQAISQGAYASRSAVAELVEELMRSGVLTQGKGRSILSKLLR